MTSVFKEAVEIQLYHKPLCEWTLYKSEWNSTRQTRTHLEIPYYQRNFVWKEEDYQSFIESILDRVQLPPVYVDTRDLYSKGVIYIIDGKHRIQALQRFFNNDLKVREMFFKDLSKNDQMEFKYSIIMPVFEVKRLTQKQIVELYLYLNFKAVPHTQQDKEKALNILSSLS